MPQRMHEHLVGEIEAGGGWISFERYMDIALYAPGLGYYSAGAHKLGRRRRFHHRAGGLAPVRRLRRTAMRRRPASARRRIHPGDRRRQRPSGGGCSVAARGARTSCRRVTGFSRSARTCASASAARFAQHLPHLQGRVDWLDRPADRNRSMGIVLANEVLDALPVDALSLAPLTACEELGVVIEDGRLAWEPRPASLGVAETCRRLSKAAGAWDEGYVSEYCPRLAAWTQAVTHSLRAGAALWFDYGLPRPQYYLPERRDGTLLCHFRHRAHDDPLLYPGLQDITAWVDYTLLAEASRAAGFALAGFTTQAISWRG